jgi:hypothetical protein
VQRPVTAGVRPSSPGTKSKHTPNSNEKAKPKNRIRSASPSQNSEKNGSNVQVMYQNKEINNHQKIGSTGTTGLST